MRNTPTTRAATTARIGPWFVHQPRNPAAPGMNLATLLSLVNKGQVTADSVVRGPTTQQLWTTAARVRGLSREFGLCFECGASFDPGSNLCPACKRSQDPPASAETMIDARPRQPQDTTAPGTTPTTTPQIELAPAIARELATSTPPSSTQRGVAERILTPKELAAAFALPDAAALPAEIPPSKTPTARELPERKLTASNALLAALVLLAVGLAAYALLNPQARAQATRRLADLRAWAEAHTADPIPKPTVPTATAPIKQAPAMPDDVAPAAIPATHREEPMTAETKPATPRPNQLASSAANPRMPPAARPPRPAIEIGPPTPTPEQPTPKPAPKQEPPPRPAAAEPPPATRADFDRAIDLYRQALEAESSGDYAAAVKHYERIRTLPRPTWPATLDRRLASAKLRAGEG